MEYEVLYRYPAATTVTTTVRVIYGILDDTANSWTNAFAALAAGAPDLDVLC